MARRISHDRTADARQPLAEPLPNTPEWKAELDTAHKASDQADCEREDRRREVLGNVYRIAETECLLYLEFRRHDDLEGVIANHLENGIDDGESADHAIWHAGRVRAIIRNKPGHAPQVIRLDGMKGGAS